ncbi:MAG: hypothetical protein K8S97_01885 [Anaerolineae bacterium]|nr:hypothetical protein [Anaerolineae bacterium]
MFTLRFSAATIRRGLLLLIILVLIVCVVLLANITASNPTHRRYSSAAPVMGNGASNQEVGWSAEVILAQDLSLANNNDSTQRQCICTPGSTPPLSQCRTCITTLPDLITATYRIPDFVSSSYLADSKNVAQLSQTQTREFQQIQDYAAAARKLDVPLWIFVRTDTDVDAAYYDMVESTGGGIVRYFTAPDYHDPMDRAARGGLIVSVPLLIGLGWWEFRTWRPKPKPPGNVLVRSEIAVDQVDTFAKDTKDRIQSKLDRYDQ